MSVAGVRLSVVIPAYQARAELEQLLRSLARCHPVDGSFEVVVADDGSTDRTGAMVEAFEAPYPLRYRYLPRGPESGRAAARNAGIAAATGDVVVLVDADQIVPPGFLRAHAEHHRDAGDVVVIGARGNAVRTAEGFVPATDRDDREPVFDRFSANLNNMASCWHYLYSCNVSVRREHLLAVGCFDEAYRGWGLEDTDLGYRLRRHGLNFVYDRGIVLHHLAKQVVTGSMVRDWQHNLRYFTAKYQAPDAAALAVIDPAWRDLEWLDAVTRLEFACRAFEGRLPRPSRPEVVEVEPGAADRQWEAVLGRTATTDLLVLDATPDAALCGRVQRLRTDHELLYFHVPEPARRAELRDHYQTGHMW